ncbi:transmembrane protein 64-like isoform X2 [Acanthaster planci]|uniref:Transmembrane protein 64-like isoform X2 n=1 Tax=Acanthaster planci TaxID=133434 RepID=A0A8B7YZJ9_ACAPL|nr:transmembrane protein 64-like isoform X2 [Acanthaster planci]
MTKLPINTGSWLSLWQPVSSTVSWGWKSHTLTSSLPPTPMSPSFGTTSFFTRVCLADCVACRFPLAQVACMETRVCTRLSTLLVVLVCGTLLLWAFQEQIKDLLPWLLGTDPYLGVVAFFILFVLVALPSSIPGYLLLNIAAGYRYGLVLGTLVVAACALGGAYCAFMFCRLACTAYFLAKLQNDYLQAIVHVVEGEHSFRVIALTRLTPIPFGLQNGVFSMANVSVSTFVMATAVGLFPNQLLSSYIGSTLRSVQDITNQQWNSSPAVVAQVCLSVSLSFYVIIKAQRHLHRAIHDHKVNQMEESSVVHATPQLLPGHPSATCGSEGKCHQPLSNGAIQLSVSVKDETVKMTAGSVYGSDGNSNEVWNM